jgi:hypothetical protein
LIALADLLLPHPGRKADSGLPESGAFGNHWQVTLSDFKVMLE